MCVRVWLSFLFYLPPNPAIGCQKSNKHVVVVKDSTPCSKTVSCLMFDNNFSKCKLMLLHVCNFVILVKHINCHIQCENWVTFLDFRLSKGSVEHTAGEVEIYVICTQRIFLRITWWKNCENRSTFAKVIIKHQTAYFFGTRCTYQLFAV